MPPTRNSEHVTCVKRHVRVTVGGGAATLRVPVLPQVRRQQARRQGGQRTCFSYLVLLHLTVEGKPVGEVVASLVTTDGQPNKNKNRPSSMPQFSMS